jgi:hypothetical protein
VRQALGLRSRRDARRGGGRYLGTAALPDGWSLYGLSKSYAAQGKAAQAGATRNGFRNAWARADVELQASRF